MTYTITAKLTSTTDAGSVHTNNVSGSGTMTAEAGSDANTGLQQNIGTSVEQLDLGDVDLTKRHWVCVRNPPSNTYQVTVKFHESTGPDVYGNDMVIWPGELLVIPCAGGASYPRVVAISTTSAQNVEVVACDAGTPVL